VTQTESSRKDCLILLNIYYQKKNLYLSGDILSKSCPDRSQLDLQVKEGISIISQISSGVSGAHNNKRIIWQFGPNPQQKLEQF
jgi:hypothetical protein